jgi:16S rRNA processing protein RimM
VVAAHGTSGKLTVKALSGDPSGLLSARVLRLSGTGGRDIPEGRDFEVKAARRSGGCAVFALNGVETVEAARSLAGARVFVPRKDLPPPGEDEYYYADLVGCSVVAGNGVTIGEVARVMHGPAHDWIEVRGPGKEAALLPFVSEFIREVDTAGRRIVVTPPEGWPHAG